MANIHDYRIGNLVEYNGVQRRIRNILTSMRLYYLEGLDDKIDFDDPKLKPIAYDNDEALADTWDKYLDQLDVYKQINIWFEQNSHRINYIHELQNAVQDDLNIVL